MSKYNTISDAFDRKFGAKVYPSNDPNDSPIDTFTCKLCGAELKLVAWGAKPIGARSFDEKIIDALKNHLLIRHVWKLGESE